MPDLEYCCLCDHETGRAGRLEDSFYINFAVDELGPLCDHCHEAAMTGARLMKRMIGEGYVEDWEDES